MTELNHAAKSTAASSFLDYVDEIYAERLRKREAYTDLSESEIVDAERYPLRVGRDHESPVQPVVQVERSEELELQDESSVPHVVDVTEDDLRLFDLFDDTERAGHWALRPVTVEGDYFGVRTELLAEERARPGDDRDLRRLLEQHRHWKRRDAILELYGAGFGVEDIRAIRRVRNHMQNRFFCIAAAIVSGRRSRYFVDTVSWDCARRMFLLGLKSPDQIDRFLDPRLDRYVASSALLKEFRSFVDYLEYSLRFPDIESPVTCPITIRGNRSELAAIADEIFDQDYGPTVFQRRAWIGNMVGRSARKERSATPTLRYGCPQYVSYDLSSVRPFRWYSLVDSFLEMLTLEAPILFDWACERFYLAFASYFDYPDWQDYLEEEVALDERLEKNGRTVWLASQKDAPLIPRSAGNSGQVRRILQVPIHELTSAADVIRNTCGPIPERELHDRLICFFEGGLHAPDNATHDKLKDATRPPADPGEALPGEEEQLELEPELL